MNRKAPQISAIQGSEAIQKLLIAHLHGDEEAFQSAAWDIVGEERRLNHSVFANELERILRTAKGVPVSKSFFAALSANNGNMPKDKDKNANLIELTQSDVEIEDLVLSPALRQSFDRIIQERRGSELLRTHGLQPASKLLFCGPPGCGKTMAASALANALYLPLATVRFDAVVSSFLGETAANLRKVFDYARVRPVLLFFDEFDAIGKERTAIDEHGELKRVVNSFLQMLDSFRSETLTVAATNHQGLLDPALWRRFDDILFFAKPSDEEIETLLCRYFRQFTLQKTIRIKSVVKQLTGMAQSDIQQVAHEAIKQVVLSNSEQITSAILNSAIERQLNRLRITRSGDDEVSSQKVPSSRSARPK